MLRTAVKGFQDVALLLARIALGAILVARGWHRWQVAGLETQMEIIEQAGLPQAQLLAVLVILFELVGGVLLVFGLATPLVGLGLVLLGAGSIHFLGQWEAGIYQHDGGYEYHLALAAAGVIFLAFGSGRLGADALFLAPLERRARAEEGEPTVAPRHSAQPPAEPAEAAGEKTIFHRNPTANP